MIVLLSELPKLNVISFGLDEFPHAAFTTSFIIVCTHATVDRWAEMHGTD